MARPKKLTDDEFLNQPFDFEKAVWIKGKVPNKAQAQKIAKEKKESRFTARVSEADFEAFKKMAAKKGIGYQTLLGQLIHEYNEGNLVDVNEVRKVIPGIKLKVI